MTDFSGKKVLVAGCGVSGLGAKEALTKRGARVVSYCDGQAVPLESFDAIVISPAFCKDHFLYEYAKEREIPIYGEYALGVALNDKPLVAVTGTNGKTTVTQMAAAVLMQDRRVSCCGNIGVSFAAEAATGDYDVAVTEVSSFQLEQTPLVKPNVAVITNLTPDHLDRHKSMTEYACAKYSIARFMDENDLLLLPYDQPLWEINLLSHRAKIEYVSTKSKVLGVYCHGGIIYDKGEPLFDVKALPFESEHLLTDALFAVAVARRMEVDKELILSGLQSFRVSDHRLQLVSVVDGVRFFNDSKSTNPDSVVKALDSMQGNVCLILCGVDKGLSYQDVFRYENKLFAVFAIGPITQAVERAAKSSDVPVYPCDSLEQAVATAFLLRPNNVLLSPGSASFDRYSSYRQRGDHFVSIVRSLANGKA